jgi:hypothetical protein
MANFDSALGDFDYQPSLFDEWTEPTVLFDDGYGFFDSALNNFDDAGVNSSIVELLGITLSAVAGTINQSVSDEIQVLGEELSIFASEITANGIQNSNIALTGLELASEFGNINEIVNDFVEITGEELAISVATISADGTQSVTHSITGLELTSAYGQIFEEVVDSISILGVDLSISAENISANATSNPIIEVNGIELQITTGLVSATGSEVVPPLESTGGEYVRPMSIRNANIKVDGARGFINTGRITPLGIVNGNARALSVQSSTQINEAVALGQLGIDEETLLMLLVA